MRRAFRTWALVVVLLTLASDAGAQQEELSSPRRTAAITILQVNDVYSIVPVDGLGGLARLATVKKQTAQALGRTRSEERRVGKECA